MGVSLFRSVAHAWALERTRRHDWLVPRLMHLQVACFVSHGQCAHVLLSYVRFRADSSGRAFVRSCVVAHSASHVFGKRLKRLLVWRFVNRTVMISFSQTGISHGVDDWIGSVSGTSLPMISMLGIILLLCVQLFLATLPEHVVQFLEVLIRCVAF